MKKALRMLKENRSLNKGERMFKSVNVKWFLILSLAIALTIPHTRIIAGGTDPFSKLQEELAGISENEKKILQSLFTLAQEMEIIEAEEKEIDQQIEEIDREAQELELAIADAEYSFGKKQEGLKQVLRSYQRMGPISYLEIILNSDSLSSFILRINTLRDLTRDTGVLLEQLESSKEQLNGAKAELMEKLALLELKHKELTAAIAKKAELKIDMEEYLTSLTVKKGYYQKQIADMQHVWKELKLLFSEAEKEFSGIIEEGNFPPDALTFDFSIFGIKASLNEKSFNDIVSSQVDIAEMIFDFKPGKIVIELPEKNLKLSGVFIIAEGHILEFEAEEGVFYDMPLAAGTIEELFREKKLSLDLEPLLGSYTLQSVEIMEDYINLTVKPNLY
ncbi:coiled-coil domain-containing protein [Lutispora sp.]|uniref:coiled-coil domain-containing protein n=1 Tax=Lutispora sp. TaxID=2828727 RepID=UPI002B207FD1|nr:hypothetical protein [Lutispora sp.]MEA4962064.1 hypothetical protein [Lutispora sp.]